MRLHLIAKAPKNSKLKVTPTRLNPKRRPKKDYFGGRKADLHIDIVDTIEALRSYLEYMETEPETPENSVRYEKAFETKMDLEGMLEGRVPLDIQVVKDAKETYSEDEESFERAVEQGYAESGQILRELRDQKGPMKLHPKAFTKTAINPNRWVLAPGVGNAGMELFEGGITAHQLIQALPHLYEELSRIDRAPESKYSEEIVVEDTKLHAYISLYKANQSWRLGAYRSPESQRAAAILYDYITDFPA